MADTFSIFILKIKSESLRQAEVFLRNRQWQVGSSTGMREALAYIIQKQPEFVLIAADHPNKKVKVLPKILAQAFPVKIIAFAEGQGGPSIAALHEMGMEYSLFPPVSGPAIERTILKIKRDEEKAKEEGERSGKDPSHHQDSSHSSGSDVVRLQGAASSHEDADAKYAQARAALNHLMSTDTDDHDNSAKGNIAYMGGAAGSETEKSGNAGIAYPGSMSPSGGGQGSSGPAEGETFSEWEARREREAGSIRQEGADNSSRSATQSGPASSQNGMDSQPQGLNEPPDPNYDYGGGANRRKQTPILESDDVAKKKRAVPRYKYGQSLREQPDSIIVRGTQAALDESVTLTSTEKPVQEINEASHCACIIVESERFSGYLVAAMGSNRKMDTDFVDIVKTRLFAFLKAHGEIVKSEESMNIKIEEVNFEGWAVEQAEFLRKSIHDGDEIAMAFFPTKETTIKLEESVSEKMLKMDISELKEDTAVEFDLYIYMPENNKYLLYTPEGRPLFGVQRDRLKEKGITHMHLRKESSHNVKKYRAQNYLNDKIQAFKAAQKIKNS